MTNLQPKERTVSGTKRVFFFANCHLSSGEQSGGDTRFREISKRAKKFDQVIITNKFGFDKYNEEKIIAKYFLTSTEKLERNIFLSYFMTMLKSLPLNLKISDGDILYSVSLFLPDVLPAFILKLKNAKAKWIICVFLVVPTPFRDYTRIYDKRDRFSLPTFRRLLYFLGQQLTISWGKRWADHILVLNKIDKEYLVNNQGLDESKVSVVNGGVDYSHIRSIETKTKLFDGVFLGRFHQQKGIFDLIEIWKLVCNKKPDARLCVIGSGPRPFVEKVNATIKEHNLSNNIELMGSKTGDEKLMLLKSGCVFLCPSYYESFAIVIAEAMACGLPVVAYNLPIYDDIYGRNIIKVPLGNLDQFADVIINFLDDEKMRTTFGLEGQKFIQKYDWDKIAEEEYRLIVGSIE
jgi:glycosyltransferase involved in cell wall biosynthesis